MGESTLYHVYLRVHCITYCRYYTVSDTMLISILLLISSTSALNINPINLISPRSVDTSNTTTTCPSHLCIRDTSTSTNVYPWLINNVQAKFQYVRTDSIDYAVYRFLRPFNGQTLTYWLHMYDEGIFYNGFWVVNDLEDGYEELTAESLSTTRKMTNVLRTLRTTGTSGEMETGSTTPTSTWSSASCFHCS